MEQRFGNLKRAPADDFNASHLNPLIRIKAAKIAKWAFLGMFLCALLEMPFTVYQMPSVQSANIRYQDEVASATIPTDQLVKSLNASDQQKYASKLASVPRPAALRIWDFSVLIANSTLTCGLILLFLACIPITNFFIEWDDPAIAGRALLLSSAFFALSQLISIDLFSDLLHWVKNPTELEKVIIIGGDASFLAYLQNKAWLTEIGLTITLALAGFLKPHSRRKEWLYWIIIILVPFFLAVSSCVSVMVSTEHGDMSSKYRKLTVSSPHIGVVLIVLMAIFFVCFLAIAAWAASVEYDMRRLRRRNRAKITGSSYRSVNGPLELTVTVIGAANRGKTTLLTGAHYEWWHAHAQKTSTAMKDSKIVISSPTHFDDPDLKLPGWKDAISPFRDEQLRQCVNLDIDRLREACKCLVKDQYKLYKGQRILDDHLVNLFTRGEVLKEPPIEPVAIENTSNDDPEQDPRWPDGTKSMSLLPFDFDIRIENVQKGTNKRYVCLRMHCHDYRGGLVGNQRSIDDAEYHQFVDRMKYTDALLLIIDMSLLRRHYDSIGQGVFDSEVGELADYCKDAMKELAVANTDKRVIPIAIVFTKCDEIWHLDTKGEPIVGVVDGDRVDRYLSNAGLGSLEADWKRMVEKYNIPTEVREFATTAIYHSSKPDNDQQPFQLKQVCKPKGCSAPFLWIAATCMHFNVSVIDNWLRWLLSSNSRIIAPLLAAQQLQRLLLDEDIWLLPIKRG